MKTPIKITVNESGAFLVLGISRRGRSWAYNISQKSIHDEGWGPIVNKITKCITFEEDQKQDNIAKVYATRLINYEMSRIRPNNRFPPPPRKEVNIVFPSVPIAVEVEEPVEVEDSKPACIPAFEYTPLPLARVYRRQAFLNTRLFFAWLRKIMGL